MISRFAFSTAFTLLLYVSLLPTAEAYQQIETPQLGPPPGLTPNLLFQRLSEEPFSDQDLPVYFSESGGAEIMETSDLPDGAIGSATFSIRYPQSSSQFVTYRIFADDAGARNHFEQQRHALLSRPGVFELEMEDLNFSPGELVEDTVSYPTWMVSNGGDSAGVWTLVGPVIVISVVVNGYDPNMTVPPASIGSTELNRAAVLRMFELAPPGGMTA
jgi:hypothetical protein